MDKKKLLGNFLFLDEMFTPKFITVIYWLGIISVIYRSFDMLFAGQSAILNRIICFPFYLIIGFVFLRVAVELLVVIFSIHSNLKKIADNKDQ